MLLRFVNLISERLNQSCLPPGAVTDAELATGILRFQRACRHDSKGGRGGDRRRAELGYRGAGFVYRGIIGT